MNRIGAERTPHNRLGRMKTSPRLFTLAFLVCALSAIAQFVTKWSHVNQVGETQVKAVASRLVIGMREKDAMGLLASNGLHVTSGIRETDHWIRIYCYTNSPRQHSCGLWLEFRQKPSSTGLIMTTNPPSGIRMYVTETTNQFVAMTNGILRAALLNGIQIARTNSPQ